MNRIHLTVIAAFIYFLSYPVSAQVRNEVGRPFITTYGPKEYRGHVQNWAILQDDRGVMYIGNGLGLLEYDGASWRLIETANKSFVRSLAKDENGRIYVGSSSDFGYLEPNATGEMHYISLLEHVREEDRVFSYV